MIDYSELDPGIRILVRLLNESGFETFASGDKGSEAGESYVVVSVDHERAKEEAHRLMQLLSRRGAEIGAGTVIACYDPLVGSSSILVTGVDDMAIRWVN